MVAEEIGHGNAELDLIFLSDGRMGAKKLKKIKNTFE